MSEWKEYKISEIADVIGGGTPKTAIEEYWNGDIPWLAPKDLTGYNKVYISHGDRFITESGLKNSSTKLMPKGSVLLTSRAPIGYVAIAENDICTNQGFKSLVPKEDISNSEFLYYWIKANVDYLQQLGTGTTFAEISGSVVKNIDITLPPLEEQKAIAEVLSSLDDKIDLLHQQNKTLEELAQTLFRQWFVKEVGDDIELSELGNFVSTIDNRGKTPPNQAEETPYPVIEVNALGKNDRLVDYSVIRKYVDKETFDNWFRKTPNKYDTLVSTVGSIGAFSMFILEKGNIAQNVIALHAETISPFYLYEVLKYKRDEIMQLDIGGVQPSIKVPHLLSIEIPILNKEKLEEFDTQVIEYVHKMELNYKQIKNLENMRYTLLPKLMSGEVRVE